MYISPEMHFFVRKNILGTMQILAMNEIQGILFSMTKFSFKESSKLPHLTGDFVDHVVDYYSSLTRLRTECNGILRGS